MYIRSHIDIQKFLHFAFIQSVIQSVNFLLFFILLTERVQVIHRSFLWFILISALDSLINVCWILIYTVWIVALEIALIVLSWLFNFAIKIDHNLFVAKVTHDGLDFTLTQISSHDFLSVQFLCFLGVDWKHVLKENRVHVHKSKQYKDSISCVFIHAESINYQHDDYNDNEQEWKH